MEAMREEEEEEIARRVGVIEDASALLAAFAGSASKPTARSVVFGLPRGSETARPIVVHLQDAASTFLTEDHTSVGLRTWGASKVFAERLVERPESLGLDVMVRSTIPSDRRRALRILELGAGTGLISLVLAKLLPRDAAQIFASDFHPQVLDNLRTNMARNFDGDDNEGDGDGDGGATPPMAVSLDWRELHDRQQCPDAEAPPLRPPFDTPFDVIIGADVVYEPSHALWIKSTVQQLLRRPTSPTGSRDSTSQLPSAFHLVMPVRPTHDEETSSVPALFPMKDAVLRERSEGGSRGLVLAIHQTEEVMGVAETGRDGDAVHYLMYHIGWI